jgi:hypothetical protein
MNTNNRESQIDSIIFNNLKTIHIIHDLENSDCIYGEPCFHDLCLTYHDGLVLTMKQIKNSYIHELLHTKPELFVDKNGIKLANDSYIWKHFTPIPEEEPIDTVMLE